GPRDTPPVRPLGGRSGKAQASAGRAIARGADFLERAPPIPPPALRGQRARVPRRCGPRRSLSAARRVARSRAARTARTPSRRGPAPATTTPPHATFQPRGLRRPRQVPAVPARQATRSNAGPARGARPATDIPAVGGRAEIAPNRRDPAPCPRGAPGPGGGGS